MNWRNTHWKFQVRYAIWSEVINTWFGNYVQWKSFKRRYPDEYSEVMHDALGTYCAGGEL